MVGDKEKEIKNIHSAKELKDALGIPEGVRIPELTEVLKFTKKELEVLKLEIAQKGESEIYEILKSIIQEKTKATLDTQKASTAGLTGIKTERLMSDVALQKPEVLRKRLETAQSSEIMSLDVSAVLEKQQSKVNLFETGLAQLIQQLAIHGVKKESISSLGTFGEVLKKTSLKLDSGSEASKEKFLEILQKGDSPIRAYLEERWNNVLAFVYAQAKDIEGVHRAVQAGKPLPAGNSLSEMITTHPYISLAVAGIGAYGLFKMIGSFTSSEGSKSEGFFGGMFDKITGKLPGGSFWKWTLGSILGLFGLGKVLGMDGVKKLFKDNLSIDLDENRLTKALQLFSDGHPIDAIKTLLSGVENGFNSEELANLKKEIIAYSGKTDQKIEDFDTDIIIKASKNELLENYLSTTGYLVDRFFSIAKKAVGLGSENAELQKRRAQEDVFKAYLKSKIDSGAIKTGKDVTVSDALKQLLGKVSPTTTQATGPEAGKMPQETEAKVALWPGMGILLGHAATGNDRALASRVIEYSAKTKYYDGLYSKYLKYKSYDIGSERIHILNGMQRFNHEIGASRGSLAELIKVEKNGGLQGLFAKLQTSSNPTEIANIKADIDAYLKNEARFAADFDRYVRKANLKRSLFNETTYECASDIEKFNLLKEQEAILGREVHEVTARYDQEILDLRKKAKTEKWDPKILADKESQIRLSFSREMHAEGGLMSRLRDAQTEMMGHLRNISEVDAFHSKQNMDKRTTSAMEQLEKEGKVSRKILPGGKLSWIMIGLTTGSLAYTGATQGKEKLAYVGAEAVGAFVPGVNMYFDARQIATGRDFAGDELAWWERWALAPAFLTLDTIGSLASLTGAGYAVTAAIGGVENAVKAAVKGGKAAKAAEGAVKVAEGAHAAEGIAKGTEGFFESARKTGFEIIDSTRNISKIPTDFIKKYREGMHAAYSSGILRAARPLATVSKFAVYGGLGYSLYTGVGEIGEVIGSKYQEAKSHIPGFMKPDAPRETKES